MAAVRVRRIRIVFLKKKNIFFGYILHNQIETARTASYKGYIMHMNVSRSNDRAMKVLVHDANGIHDIGQRAFIIKY